MTATYGLGEARERMARYGLHTGDREAFKEAEDAIPALLAALKELSAYGFTVSVDNHTAAFTIVTGSQVQVIYTAGETSCFQIGVTRKRNANVRDPQFRALPVLFDSEAKLFSGKDFDDRIAPEPGKLRPRRSAVAVIVEAAIDALKMLE